MESEVGRRTAKEKKNKLIIQHPTYILTNPREDLRDEKSTQYSQPSRQSPAPGISWSCFVNSTRMQLPAETKRRWKNRFQLSRHPSHGSVQKPDCVQWLFWKRWAEKASRPKRNCHHPKYLGQESGPRFVRWKTHSVRWSDRRLRWDDNERRKSRVLGFVPWEWQLPGLSNSQRLGLRPLCDGQLFCGASQARVGRGAASRYPRGRRQGIPRASASPAPERSWWPCRHRRWCYSCLCWTWFPRFSQRQRRSRASFVSFCWCGYWKCGTGSRVSTISSHIGRPWCKQELTLSSASGLATYLWKGAGLNNLYTAALECWDRMLVSYTRRRRTSRQL